MADGEKGYIYDDLSVTDLFVPPYGKGISVEQEG